MGREHIFLVHISVKILKSGARDAHQSGRVKKCFRKNLICGQFKIILTLIFFDCYLSFSQYFEI